MSKRKLKKEHKISFGTGKNTISQTISSTLHLERWGLGILDIDTQLNPIKTKWTQRLLNPTNVLWKDLMLY